MLQKETKTVSTVSRCKDERGEGMKGGEGELPLMMAGKIDKALKLRRANKMDSGTKRTDRKRQQQNKNNNNNNNNDNWSHNYGNNNSSSRSRNSH